MSAWAALPIGALWTVNTAVAEASVISQAAVAADRAVFDAWWIFAEAMGNGFAAALAFTVIAGSESRRLHGTPAWASWIAAAAGAASFAGWVLGSWVDVAIGAPVWLVSSLVVCLWLAWFGFSLGRA